LHDQLILRPFPQGNDAETQWDQYRSDMLAYSGIAIFVFGNKLEGSETILAEGVRKEFNIAKEKNIRLIPIGATGFMAEVLWDLIIDDFSNFYPDFDESFKELFVSLGDKEKDLMSHVETIIKIIDCVK